MSGMGGHPLDHHLRLRLDDPGDGRSRLAPPHQHVLVGHRGHPGKGDLPLFEQTVDGGAVDRRLDEAGGELVDLDGVRPIVLDVDTELCTLDAEGGVLRDEHRIAAVVVEVETGGEQPIVGGRRVEDLRKPIGDDAVELDAEGAAPRERHSLPETSVGGCAELFEEPDRGAGVRPDLVHPSLLPVQLLDHHEWEHDVVLIESNRRVGIGEQDTRVEDVGTRHRLRLLWTAPGQSSPPRARNPRTPAS
jgi:hypothetical protein